MRFRLVPKSSTLDDLELLYVQIFSEFCASWRVWEATTAKPIKTDKHCQQFYCCTKQKLRMRVNFKHFMSHISK